MTVSFLHVVAILFYSIVTIDSAASTQPFTLTILHTNDVHSRFLEFDNYGLTCRKNEMCFGGFSRMAYKVNELRQAQSNILYLSAGDYFQGTLWYTLYNWTLLSRYVNEFGLDAMVLGNHEFDGGVEGLVPFMARANFPIVSANIDVSLEPSLAQNLRKSVVLEIDGREIGVIGYTLKDTMVLSKTGKCKFEDEVTAVMREAAELNRRGIKIIIALGHADFDVDLNVAKVPYVDVVVGGHSNTFLYTGSNFPSVEVPTGPYPMIINSSGHIVPVVQAFEFGKYLGYLNVTFDIHGDVINWTGNPILLDRTIPQDLQMEEELQLIAKTFPYKIQKIVGKTDVFLDGLAKCRGHECNLGNVVADAMVEAINHQLCKTNQPGFVSMAILSSGQLRASISSQRTISLEDIMIIYPFGDTVDLVQMTGKDLRAVFEFSIANYDLTGLRRSGRFLQISGIRVTFDVTRPPGQRVKELMTVHFENEVPSYKPVRSTDLYTVAIPTYMVGRGGDGYEMIRRFAMFYYKSQIRVSDAVRHYVKHHSPITQTVENRTTILWK